MRICSPIVLLFVLEMGLCAQTFRGALGVTVRDGSRAVVRQAQVVITDRFAGRQWTAQTDNAGIFMFPSLPPGDYRLVIDSPGFRRHAQSVTLTVGQEQQTEILLQPGDRTETVEVLASSEPLQPESAALGITIENKPITALPLDGRNFVELALLSPGAGLPAQGSAGTARGEFTFQSNGGREDANAFLLDGVNNSDPKLNGVGVTPSVDAIREFEVLTGNYDASFARNSGGQVNVVVKSGSNALHGTLYEFFRNQAMDARNFFAPAGPDPRYQRNQFGGAIGGPIVKNRTFFFLDYEGRRSREGITRTTRVPTPLERNGDFSRSDPRTPPIDIFTQTPFPGGVIPSSRIHPIARGILGFYPQVNRADFSQNFSAAPSLRDQNHTADLRMDHRLARNSDLAVRYSIADRASFEPYAGANFAAVPGFGNNLNRRAQNLMAAETHAFTPSFLNELRFGFNRVTFSAAHQNSGTSLNRQIGLPETSANPRDFGLSFINVAGYSSVGDEYNNPQSGTATTWQVLDHLTWTRGRHLFRFGGDLRLTSQRAYRDVMSRGLISFTGFTGNGLAELLQGVPTVTSVSKLDNPQNLRTQSYSLFAHDQWRLTAKLTLTLGARYEYNRPPYDADNRASVFDPTTRSLVPLGSIPGTRGAFLPDRNNLAPRFGIAYALRPGTILRAGYGIYYDQAPLAPGEGIYFNSPYFQLNTYFIGQDYLLFLNNPYPADFPTFVPPSAVTFQRDYRTAYSQHWSLNMHQSLGGGRVVEFGYVGTKASKLLAGRDGNQAAPSAAPLNLRPDPRWGDITYLESRANSNYHSLQTRLEQRMARGFSLLASYTLGKSIDDASGFFASAGDPNFPMDSNHLALERARSGFDIRHRLTAAYVFDIPFGRRRWYGGWQTNGVWTFQTGRPFTVSLLSDLDQSNTGRTSYGFGANDRPNRLSSGLLSSPTPERWFDTASFFLQPFGTLGNAGRNILDGPGLAVMNLSIVKNTAISERTSLQFRAEAFNALNRTNFDLPDSTLGSGTFGRVLSSGPPRHLQLGLKLLF
ncbi:MAG TPA: TonB-dependent receptor [Bryobacteraceae bacterium]|nr:TonB-dependent receptor [Bryobacteraceae bacterium]